jgi:hypothetical protein
VVGILVGIFGTVIFWRELWQFGGNSFFEQIGRNSIFPQKGGWVHQIGFQCPPFDGKKGFLLPTSTINTPKTGSPPRSTKSSNAPMKTYMTQKNNYIYIYVTAVPKVSIAVAFKDTNPTGSAKQDDIYGASNIVLPCPGS